MDGLVGGAGDRPFWPPDVLRAGDEPAHPPIAPRGGTSRSGGRGARDHGRLLSRARHVLPAAGPALLYLALGLSWAFTAFGRLVSILSDRGSTAYNWISLLIELALATLPLAFALGFVA
jgi:hypothetical protein